jgi:class 3 adenylate cyclase
VQLETALGHLSASMRKVEILESVKENLCKFVPVSVSRMIEKSPTGAIPKRKRQDLSVLFLDIEGYTKLCEKLGSSETSEIIEKHFSVFMDAIYTNNGDVNETAGDGLMVLFLNEDEETNALEAVRTALSVREETVRICKECPALYRPLDINIGINSGRALVGAAKFDTYSGSRWTYTARGRLTNVAARIGSQASGGSIYLSRTTADRVNEHFSPFTKGKFKLKNVSEEVEIFEL